MSKADIEKQATGLPETSDELPDWQYNSVTVIRTTARLRDE